MVYYLSVFPLTILYFYTFLSIVLQKWQPLNSITNSLSATAESIRTRLRRQQSMADIDRVCGVNILVPYADPPRHPNKKTVSLTQFNYYPPVSTLFPHVGRLRYSPPHRFIISFLVCLLFFNEVISLNVSSSLLSPMPSLS